MDLARIAVLVPTLRRPASLARALRSLFTQDHPDRIAAIVVVDNSPEASARTAVESLRALSPISLVYVHEPRPGVATARNAGLAATDAPLIAFLDDDEEAPPSWLAALYDAHQRFGAAVTFGPVQGVATGAIAWARPYLDRFFSRLGPAASGPIDEAYGCGNSLMTRSEALPGAAPFDEASNETGGEDDRLFAALRARGGRFAWAADASVLEHAPAERARLGYALSRAFGYGQTPAQLCARAGDRLGVARWMAVGAAQAAAFGAVAGVFWLARSSRRAEAADRAARGLGKVFWWMRLRFYGRAALKRRPAAVGALTAA